MRAGAATNVIWEGAIPRTSATEDGRSACSEIDCSATSDPDEPGLTTVTVACATEAATTGEISDSCTPSSEAMLVAFGTGEASEALDVVSSACVRVNRVVLPGAAEPCCSC